MLENPDILRNMIRNTGAASTDMEAPESVEQLCSRCDHYAEHWKATADELWENCQKKREHKAQKQV